MDHTIDVCLRFYLLVLTQLKSYVMPRFHCYLVLVASVRFIEKVGAI